MYFLFYYVEFFIKVYCLSLFSNRLQFHLLPVGVKQMGESVAVRTEHFFSIQLRAQPYGFFLLAQASG